MPLGGTGTPYRSTTVSLCNRTCAPEGALHPPLIWKHGRTTDIFLKSQELAAQGLGAVFAIFLVAIVLVRIATAAGSGPVIRKLAFIGAWAALTIAPAFRVVSQALGAKDSYQYKLQFLSSEGARGLPMSKTGTGAASEPLYLLSIRVLRMFTDDPHVFFFIAFGVIAWGILYFIAKTVRAASPVLPLLVIFPAWLHAFSAIRNWVAISLVLVALTFYIRKRLRWFYVWVVIATGFHFSAALVLVLPFVVWMLFRRRVTGWTIFVLAVMNLIGYGSSSVLEKIFIGTRYEEYLNGQTSKISFILPMLVLTLTGVFILRSSELFSDDQKRLLNLPVFVCGFLTIVLFYGGYRYVEYTTVPLAVVASWSMTEIRHRMRSAPASVANLLWGIIIYISLYKWALGTLRSVINLSGVFPVIWGR